MSISSDANLQSLLVTSVTASPVRLNKEGNNCRSSKQLLPGFYTDLGTNELYYRQYYRADRIKVACALTATFHKNQNTEFF